VPWPSRGTRVGDLSPTLAQCNDKLHLSHYYLPLIHNPKAAVDAIWVSKHGRRGLIPCRHIDAAGSAVRRVSAAGASASGEDLAVTSGASVSLYAVFEVIQSVVPYSGRQGRVHERR
jgi:hypothetical protein